MNTRNSLARLLAVTLIFGAAAVSLTSCSKQTSTDSTTTTTTNEPLPAPAPALNDANIAAIVLAANNADIDNGKQAQSISKSAEVKAFAKLMVTDHSSVNDKAKALATRLSLTPEENATSTGIKSSQDSVRTVLAGKTGADYNSAYVDNEVAYHQAVLDAIDQTLIPNAQNADLKQLLTDTRPTVAGHLEHAKMLQSKLAATAGK